MYSYYIQRAGKGAYLLLMDYLIIQLSFAKVVQIRYVEKEVP